MRCLACGWILSSNKCPCGATTLQNHKAGWPLDVGSLVLARPGIGPSMYRWDEGKIVERQGALHRVETRYAAFWCEPKDIFPLRERDQAFADRDQRVWAWCLDGRWYQGAIDQRQGALRYVQWDDGDAMWLAVSHVVHLVVGSGRPSPGHVVLAPRWDGDMQYCKVEQLDDDRVQVVFSDGDETWFDSDELTTFAPNPFHEP